MFASTSRRMRCQRNKGKTLSILTVEMQGNLLLATQRLLYRLLKANAQTIVNSKKKPDWKCSSTPAVISGQTFKLHGFTRGKDRGISM